MNAPPTTALTAPVLTDIMCAAPPLRIPPESPPAAATAPLRKLAPQVFCTPVYNAGWPLSSRLLSRPGAYGTELSKLMYGVRTLRVHEVQRLAFGIDGCRSRKSTLFCAKVIALGTMESVLCAEPSEPETEDQSDFAARPVLAAGAADAEADALLAAVWISVAQNLPESSFAQSASV